LSPLTRGVPGGRSGGFRASRRARPRSAPVQGLSNSGSTAEINAIVSDTQTNSGSTL
jgi:hypothetical protein